MERAMMPRGEGSKLTRARGCAPGQGRFYALRGGPATEAVERLLAAMLTEQRHVYGPATEPAAPTSGHCRRVRRANLALSTAAAANGAVSSDRVLRVVVFACDLG